MQAFYKKLLPLQRNIAKQLKKQDFSLSANL